MAKKKAASVVDIESAPTKKAKATGAAATLERSELAAALASVARAVGSSSVVPALGDVKMTFDGATCTLVATDLDVVMQQDCAIAVDGQDGTLLAPARLLSNVVSAADGPVSIGLEDGKVVASSGDFVARLETHPLADFPTISPVTGPSIKLDAQAFRQLLAIGLVAASNDAARPVLTGLYFDRNDQDTLRVVATDSYRMVIVDSPIAPLADGPIIVPGKAAALIANVAARNDTATFKTDMQRIEFAADSAVISARLIEGSFPEYRRLLPTETRPKVIVNRAALAKAVKRVRVLLDNDRALTVELTSETLTIRAGSQAGSATESVPCSFDGDTITMAFSGPYLSDALAVVSEDESGNIEIAVGSESKPSIFVGGGVQYLLMPVRNK